METSRYLWERAGGRDGGLSSDVADPLQSRAVSGAAAEGVQEPQNGWSLVRSSLMFLHKQLFFRT